MNRPHISYEIQGRVSVHMGVCVCVCVSGVWQGSTAVPTALDLHVMHLARIAKTCFPLLYSCHYLLCRPESDSRSL